MKFELRWIAWESTRNCNLNCIHCRSLANNSLQEHINTEQAFLLLRKVADFAKPVFVLSGGEPLLRKDIFEIAEYGSKLGLKMALATNGTLITDEICKKIKDSGIKVVALSLDGSSAEVHDDFRKQIGAFDGILRGIEILKKHGIDFIINSSFTKRNQHDIENTYKLAKSLGAKAWYMFIIVPTGRAKELLDELISKEDYEKILNWHYEVEQEEESMFLRPICAPSYYRIFVEKSLKDKKTPKRRSPSFSPGGTKGCVAAQTIAYIDSKGDVYPCSYFPISAGNIFEKSMEEIWNSDLFRSFRDFSLYEDRCGECEFVRICGGCRARALIYNGNYLAQDPYCDYIPKKMRGSNSYDKQINKRG